MTEFYPCMVTIHLNPTCSLPSHERYSVLPDFRLGVALTHNLDTHVPLYLGGLRNKLEEQLEEQLGEQLRGTVRGVVETQLK
jgi:hypothetical protein